MYFLQEKKRVWNVVTKDLFESPNVFEPMFAGHWIERIMTENGFSYYACIHTHSHSRTHTHTHKQTLKHTHMWDLQSESTIIPHTVLMQGIRAVVRRTTLIYDSEIVKNYCVAAVAVVSSSFTIRMLVTP